MARYLVSMYTAGPVTRWNVIDRQTQEWVRRFTTKEEAEAYVARAARISHAYRNLTAQGGDDGDCTTGSPPSEEDIYLSEGWIHFNPTKRSE